MGEVYGASYRDDARSFRTRLDQLPTGDEALLAFMADMSCRFPGLGNPTALHYPGIALATPREELLGWIRESLLRLDDETVPAQEVARTFGRSGATTYGGAHCSAIVLGQVVADGAYPLHDRDTILHEVGHVLDLSSRAPTAGAYQPRAVEEALADVISHAYSGSACHRPTVTGGCSRRLDEPTASIDAPPGALPSWYPFRQPARFAGWNAVKDQPITTAGPKLLAARDAALAVPRAFPADLLLGRKSTDEDKAVILAMETGTQDDFIAALAR